MKFKLPKIASTLYSLLTISIALLSFLPIATGELLNLSESIWIWGTSVTFDTLTSETLSFTYDVTWGFSTAIKPLFLIGLVLGGLFSTTIGQITRTTHLSDKTQIIIMKISRAIHMVGGVLGFTAMMLFSKFINHLNELLSIYKLGALFYIATIIFGLMIVLGFFATISEIDLIDPMRASSPDDEEEHQFNDNSTEDEEVMEDDDDNDVLKSPELDEIM